MSTPFEEYFDRNMFVINLARRPDRREHFEAEMATIGVTCVERFDAIDYGPDLGNHSCTASHRAVLDLIVQRGLQRAFIFEDDATLREPFRDSFNEEVAPVLREIPDDYDMLYFGGHYAEDPRGWHSRHLILMGAMKTTSSYGVTLKSARELRDLIPVGSGDSIDNLYANYNATKRCYITEPRFFVQYNNYSDLQRRQMNNSACMEDNSHVARLGGVNYMAVRKPAAEKIEPTPLAVGRAVPPPVPPPPVKYSRAWSGRRKNL